MSTSFTSKGDEQGNPKQIYSTDEVLTGGVWIDGSPIYRKVAIIEDLPQPTRKINLTSYFNSLDKILSCQIITDLTSYDSVIVQGFNYAGTFFYGIQGTDGKQLSALTPIGEVYDLSNSDTITIILEYTKTP